MANFEPNAILRGVQLTLVGASRALQNPRLFTSRVYRQAAIAVAAGIAVRILVAIPILLIQALLWMLTKTGMSTDSAASVQDTLSFIENYVLQVPFFLVSLMRHLSPAMDTMFMESLRWIDETYTAKHKSEDPSQLREMYYPTMKLYATRSEISGNDPTKSAFLAVLKRYGRKAGISLAIFALSGLPYIGRFVLPAASFYTFNKAVGFQPAIAIFGTGVFLPRRYLVVFLQSYFSSRTLMRELLEPYFSRIRYTKDQKKRWFHDREGVLFGFGVGFYIFLKIPLLGVLIYGIAEASTAYLITKITDPPPPPEVAEAENYVESQVRWRNKHEFLNLDLNHLDALNERLSRKRREEKQTSNMVSGKEFT